MQSFDKKILITRLGVDKVKPKGWVWGCGDLGFWELGLHAEDGGLPQVLPLTVQLKFFDSKVGGTILKLSYLLNFFVGPLHA